MALTGEIAAYLESNCALQVSCEARPDLVDAVEIRALRRHSPGRVVARFGAESLETRKMGARVPA